MDATVQALLSNFRERVGRLEEENRQLQKIVFSLAERVAAQSDVLAAWAEKRTVSQEGVCPRCSY